VRVDVIQELDSTDPTLEIPWASPTNPDLHYVDLRARPQQIDQLAECRRYPALAALLRTVNAADTSLRTAKCDIWVTTELAEDERLEFTLPCKVGSYVDLVFDRRDWNSRLEPYLHLGNELSRRLGQVHVQAQMEACVRRCLFHPEERWGYYLTVFTHAYGASPHEAEGAWQRALRALGNALAQIGRRLRDAPADPVRPLTDFW
jgi:hypothetical protein